MGSNCPHPAEDICRHGQCWSCCDSCGAEIRSSGIEKQIQELLSQEEVKK